MHRTAFTGAALAGLFVLVVLGAPAAGQQAEPLIVDADQITFDQLTQIVQAEGNVRLRYRGIRLTADRVEFNVSQEQLVAEGRVVLVDADGRELRGRRIRYDVRLQVADVEQAQAIVERVYVRSARLQAQPQRLEAEDALITTCNPANPAYRITAEHIEIVPGDRLVARQASLWVGRFRILSVPVLTVSLRTGEETARSSFPRLGYNYVDGAWIDYPYNYRLGPVDGTLYLKYGWHTRFIPRNTLALTRPRYALSLTVGRNQNQDMLLYDLAEAMLETPALPLGSLPLSYAVSARTGWFREPARGVETSRTQYEVRLQSAGIPLGAQTSLSGHVGFKDAHYGMGTRYGVATANVNIAYRVSAESSINLLYRVFDTIGSTPFLFDAVRVEDLVNRADLQYTRTIARTTDIRTTFASGVFYDFRGRTPGVSASYGQRIGRAYHWNLGAEYHLSTRAIKLLTDSGRAFGGTYVTVQAAYFPLTGQFEDLDLLVSSRVCDCFNLTFTYRHIRRQFWLEIGLAPDARVEFPEEGGSGP